MTDEDKLRIKRLEEEGWIKQFIADEPRLSEAVEVYKGAGFEVHLEPLLKGQVCETCAGPEEPRECLVCFDGYEDLYKIIFTRARKEKRSGQAVDLRRAEGLTGKEE